MKIFRFLYLVTVVVLVANFSLALYFYFGFDLEVPKHIDFFGNPSGYAGAIVLFKPGISSLLFVLFFQLVLKNLWRLNFPVELNERNREIQFFYMEFMLRSLLLSIVLIAFCINLGRVLLVFYGISIFGLSFIFGSLMIVFTPIFWFAYLMVRHR